jgi:AraC-like DNA-binding protein
MSDTQGAVSCVEIWRPAQFEAIELHNGSNVTVEYPRHWHDEFYLSATIEGASYVECSGATFAVAPGQLVILPPGEVHANKKAGCTARTVFLDVGAMRDGAEQFLEQRLPNVDFRAGLVDDAPATNEFLRMHRSLEAPRFELQQESGLFLFLSRLMTRHGAATVTSSRTGRENLAVRRARQFLAEHYAERILLRDLARHTRVSPYHLNHSFCETVGMPPHAYQTQLRIAHAKRFLRAGQSVSYAANLVGFFDQSHFVHAFKRSEGVTPSQYVRFRKNLQDGRLHTQYFGA